MEREEGLGPARLTENGLRHPEDVEELGTTGLALIGADQGDEGMVPAIARVNKIRIGTLFRNESLDHPQKKRPWNNRNAFEWPVSSRIR